MKKANILVVDDSVVVLLVLNNALKHSKYKLFIAHNGREAIKILSKEKIDLVFLDLIMPEISGFDLLDHMKGNEKLKDIPVIAFSSVQDPIFIHMAKEKGAIEFILKPVLPETLVQHINSALKLK